MDMRVERTRRNIINAFLKLRAGKPLEKITVKELADIAEINKSTFYLHYHDIYDLSESLEREVVRSTLNSIEHTEEVLRDNKLFIRELADAFVVNEQLIKILFEGSRSASFITLLENELMSLIHSVYPDYDPGIQSRMVMSFLIYGGYYTYFKYCDSGVKSVLEVIEKLSDGILRIMTED